MPKPPSPALKGLSAIVTGSTSGIGQAIAERLAQEGCDIMLGGFGEKGEIERYRKALAKKYRVAVRYSGADMARPEEVREMVHMAEQELGRVDILVNNAGIQYTAPVEKFPQEQWESILAVNLSACFHGIKAVLPGMQERNFGRIVNIASVHGLVASAEKSAYVAAKHGLVGLTKVVAVENARRNITCNAICPGWIETPLVKKQIEERAQKSGETYKDEARKLVGEKQPNQRFLSMDAVTDAVLYLVSPANTFTTGAALTVDGGWTAV